MSFKSFCLSLMIFIQCSGAGAKETPWEIHKSRDKAGRDVIDVVSHYKEKKKGKVVEKTKSILKITSEKFNSLVVSEVVYVPSMAKNILVTVWTWGAHSELIKLFDPAKNGKKGFCSYLSAAPPSITLKDGHLMFKVPDPKDNRLDPDFIDVKVDKALINSKECRAGNP